ncbi:MAG TPA: glycosyl hydrolase family 28-related protein [Stellaceae bacterium]|nr:glycosyl hydrolase family 28-related protein [Stellaceae bacterium]
MTVVVTAVAGRAAGAARGLRDAPRRSRKPHGQVIVDRLLALAAGAASALAVSAAWAQAPGNFSTLSTTGTATLGGAVLVCSGSPWIDVKCNGAVGDDSHDDTSAIQATIAAAITHGWPVHIPAGTYKVTGGLVIDYAGQAGSGFRLVSEGAAIDGTSIASGPVLQVECSGGTVGSPAGCFYFKEEGALFVRGNTPGYAVVIGKSDFSDAQNAIKLDHLVVNNASTAAAAGGLQLNYVLNSDIYAVADSAGGAAGIALEQTQFSRISGAGSAAATGGAAMLLENGFNFANTVFGFDFEVAPTCLAITFNHDGQNTFVSPYFNCATAVNATASTRNLLINPTYAGLVVNRGPQSTGVQVVGGSWAAWQFPGVASYTAGGVDDGTAISSYNAPGASLAVTLPAPDAVNAGWRMGFATDNGKGMTVTAPSGAILSGGKALSSVTLGPGNYEYLALQSDGTNFRVTAGTRNTLATNGLQSRDWPGNWLYPSTAGYAAQLGDNGNVVSSYNTGAGLTVTLPPTTNLPSGWSMGFATDQDKPLTVQVNGTSGGHILYPLINAAAQTSLTLAGEQYEYVTLQYDGSGNFRVEQVTLATAQQLGLAGSGGLSRWRYPAASAYTATLADNGTALSADNSPLGFLTVTLPAASALNAGWTVAIANDNGKLAAAQVAGGDSARILYPGSGATMTALALAAGDYEQAVLQFDGSNFRVMQVTPASAAALGLRGAGCFGKASFPAVSAYSATPADCGLVVSSYNSPIASITVTLPSTTTIAAGWSMGFTTDNGKALTVQVNGTSGGRILLPGTRGAQSSLTLYGQNYEFLKLEFDGANFRVAAATPASASANGMFPATGTPSSSGAACQTGQVEADSDYLYFCTAPNNWKRAAWSSF